ncbi:MAG TPA: phosphoglucosamine mutase [Clostridiales bacterium]|jgi:phosphoglucosamine mutase|nr:phosphoglucosamine mutase [Clostridiales bacterium]
MGRYFGTDGFRGEANDILTADKAYKIGRFLGWYYTKQSGRPARIVIGKDTRRSSYMFEYAISAGVAASGADAYLLHVTTTPSVSYVTRLEDFDCGVMISASHNPCYDNGIKLVDGSGVKMDDDTIDKIEKYLDGDLAALGVEGGDIPLARREKIGRSIDYAAGRNRYIGYLISLAAVSFKDYKVGLDCANGSAWMIARSVFEALGARTYVIGAEPNGDNINLNVGSTHIEALKRFVREKGLDIGFAYDGDADRCIAVDECGNEVNGDHIMYIFARDLKDEGRLANNTVVTTIMSNMGLYRALREAGIDYVQTTVGDKYVYENMQQFGHVLGGEQSGHIILGKYATTGDGILTSIKLMETVVSKKTRLSKLAAPVTIFPQITKNIRVLDKKKPAGDPDVIALLGEINKKLGEGGRILLRQSGTEPVVRIMVEAEEAGLCELYAGRVADLIYAKGLDR